jgi:hypothetical protein
MPLFVGICVALAAVPIWFLIDADVGRLPLALSFAAGFVGGMLASPPGPNARSVDLAISNMLTLSSRCHHELFAFVTSVKHACK